MDDQDGQDSEELINRRELKDHKEKERIMAEKTFMHGWTGWDMIQRLQRWGF